MEKHQRKPADSFSSRGRRHRKDSWYLTTAERSERARRTVAKHGKVGNNLIWTREEVATLRKHWPERDLIVTLLKRRTRRAIGSKAVSLGLTAKNHTWTAEEVLRLRKLYPRTSSTELRAIFGLSWVAIKGKARQLKLYRPAFKTQWLKSGERILDAVRDRAKEFGYSVQDVLDLANMKPRHKSIFYHQLRATPNQLDAMVEALGGRIVIEWID